MERAKRMIAILSSSFALLLVVCLILSVASVVMLARNARDAEADALRIEAGIRALSVRIERVEDRQKAESAVTVPKDEEKDAMETDKKADVFVLRDVGGKIALFDANGNCLKKSDFDTALLPAKEQKALLEGIEITSLQELLSLMQDYGM